MDFVKKIAGKPAPVQTAPAQQPVPTAPVQTAPVQQPAPTAPTAPVQQPIPPQQPAAPAPAQPVYAAPAPQAPVPTTAPVYTMDDLTRAAIPLMDSGKQPELIQLLRDFMVEALPALPPEQFGAFATALRGLGAQI